MPDLFGFLGAFRRRESATLAVLPFDCDSGDTLCAGWHEALIDGLQTMVGLSVLGPVTARAYRAFSATAVGIPAGLGVTALLTGEVRRSGPTLHCLARLSSADDDGVLWSRSWDVDLEDLFGVHKFAVEPQILAFLERGAGVLKHVPSYRVVPPKLVPIPEGLVYDLRVEKPRFDGLNNVERDEPGVGGRGARVHGID